jgi:hypothetical protein
MLETAPVIELIAPQRSLPLDTLLCMLLRSGASLLDRVQAPPLAVRPILRAAQMNIPAEFRDELMDTDEIH